MEATADTPYPRASSDGYTVYVNGSTCDHSYLPLNPLVVFDLPHDKSLPPIFLTSQIPFNQEQVRLWLHEEQLEMWADVFSKFNVDGHKLSTLVDCDLKPIANQLLGETYTLDPKFLQMVNAIVRLRCQHYH